MFQNIRYHTRFMTSSAQRKPSSILVSSASARQFASMPECFLEVPSSMAEVDKVEQTPRKEAWTAQRELSSLLQETPQKKAWTMGVVPLNEMAESEKEQEEEELSSLLQKQETAQRELETAQRELSSLLQRQDEDEEEEVESEEEDEALEQEFRQMPAQSPNMVRSRIRKLISDKGLKVKDIQALIGESPGPAWNKFMNGKYKDQSWAYSNDAYRKAAFFLYKEKRLGKQGKLVEISKKSAKSALPDVSGITTDGKTYLTPGECRTSLLAIFKKYHLTHGKLAKLIGQNPAMVGRFMSDGGPFGGSDKGCYHPLADFVEKVRIATGAKKSRKRLAIDEEGEECPYLGDDASKRYLVMAGESLYLGRDALGRQMVKHQRTH